MRLPSLLLWWFVAAGALAGWILAGIVPAGLRQPHLHGKDFVLARAADQPIEITPARWCFLPFLFGDFDLQMDVELAADTDLDLLVRQVQPRLIDGERLPFTERFTVLRMSTARRGPAWRSRDDALLPERSGGVELAPGLLATVWVQGRGRMLRANVAGTWLPWREADDDYGMFTLLVHGGNAVLHGLRIQDLGMPGAFRWSRWFWALLGALGSAVVAGGASALGARRGLLAAAAVAPPLLAFLLARWYRFDLQWPAPLGLLLLLVTSLGASLLWLRGWRLLLVIATCLLAGYGAEAVLSLDTARADALFGPRAGAQPSEALGRLVRGPGGLHDLGRPGARVFLLGGQPLYDRGDTGDHLEARLAVALRAARKQPIEVPCLPTVEGNPVQQWRLFTTCYADAYRPQVVVFGVGPDAAIDGVLPAVTPEQLASTIAAAAEHCRTRGSVLVLFADAAVPAPLLAVLRAAERDGLPLVVAADGASPTAIGNQLAAVIAPLLK
jgi:hypothetical protein